MPRKSKGPRLYLDRERKQWAIRDGSSFVRTGCAERDNEGAEKQLAEYIARKYRPAAVASPLIADVLLVYAKERLPKTKAGQSRAQHFEPDPFWGKKRADDVNSDNCNSLCQRSPAGSRPRDLEVLRAALLYWNKHKAALSRIPAVVLPDKSSRGNAG
jgi:hypothetical protein